MTISSEYSTSRRLNAARWLTVVFLATLTGCYPQPHEVWLTQPFSAVLLNGGQPMSGVTVTVSHTRGDSGNFCEHPEVVATTNAAGEFRVPARIEHRLFTSILNAPNTVLQSMSVCFSTDGKQKLGAVVTSATHHEVAYSAACEWSSQEVQFKSLTAQEPHEWGICSRTGDVSAR